MTEFAQCSKLHLGFKIGKWVSLNWPRLEFNIRKLDFTQLAISKANTEVDKKLRT